MRKVVFKINDLQWMKKFYKLSEKQFNEIFENQTAFKVIYTLTGHDSPDKYTLTDYEGNKVDINSLNGYEKGVVLNDCYAYYMGQKYHSDTKEPCGVIDIQELIV